MQSLDQSITILGRSLRLQCPQCGRGKLLEQGFTARKQCEECGLVFEREPEYWNGAIYVNLVTTQVLIIGGLLFMMFATDLRLWAQVVILGAVGIMFPIAFYLFSKSIWLGMDYFFTISPESEPPARRLDSRS